MNLGNYKVLNMIGEGGFGRTYSAEHVILKEKTCLKQNLSLTAADAALLIQEAKTMWNIHHHSLPVMRDFFKDADMSGKSSITGGKSGPPSKPLS